MTKLYIKPKFASMEHFEEYIECVNRLVCNKGYEVIYKGGRLLLTFSAESRHEMISKEAANFVRSYISEGFEDQIVIGY